MREILFDISILTLGVVMIGVACWLLANLSDRRVLRRLRPPFPFASNLTHDQTVGQRSLNVAFPAVILLFIGVVCVLAGILRLFGIGRG